MASCPNFVHLMDWNTAHFPVTDGPSLQQSSATCLNFNLPVVSVQGRLPVGLAFPKVVGMQVKELMPGLMTKPKQIGGHELGGDKHVEAYVEKIFGPAKHLMGVQEMVLSVILPNEKFDGQWKQMKPEEFALYDVLKRFKGIRELNLMAAPPYTRDRSQAFMLVSFEHRTVYDQALQADQTPLELAARR